jgi:PAS domain S-box-containing protein
MNSDNSRNRIIFVLDDDEAINKVCEAYLRKSQILCTVYTFTDYNSMLNHKELNNVSLFVLDINLNNIINGLDVCTMLPQHLILTSTFLFISGAVSDEIFEHKKFQKLKCTYDFIEKPFSRYIFTNRCKLLIDVSDKLHAIHNTKRKIELSLWDVFNYSNIYLIILDRKLNIRLCSYMLATDLGFKSEDDIIGMNWNSFLPDPIKPHILKIHTNVIENNTNKTYQEVTNDIVTKDGKIIEVKWFNSCINNGIKLSFSIGLPLTKDITKEDNIETMRSYWLDKISKDKTTIDAFKAMLLLEK